MISKIALVNMCYPKDAITHSPSLGLLSIASFLHDRGIESHIYDISIDLSVEKFDVEHITEYISAIEEPIIGISTWDSVLAKILLSVYNLKSKADKIVVLGGPTASNMSNLLMETFPFIDYCIEGEGEYPLYNLVEWINSGYTDVDLLSSKIVGRNGDSTLRGHKTSISFGAKDLPIINYDYCEVDRYNRFEISSTRGCPFRCEFCSVNSTLETTIIRSLDEVFKDIQTLFEETLSDTVNFVDDNFGLSKSRLQQFCAQFKEKYPEKKWTCYFRLSDLTKENVDMMADSGCIGVFIGIETGSQDGLSRLGKSIKTDELLRRIRYATSKFDVTASFIWGFPDETEIHLLDTFYVINKITEYDNIIVDLYQLSPLSGTRLTQKMAPTLVFDKDAVSGFIFPPHMPKLSMEEIELITLYPKIFSAYYHDNSECFGNKLRMVHKFLGELI